MLHHWRLERRPTPAQAAGRPLVALESTIVAHGMPYPENVRTAREVEALIRDLGAEPATIALIGGCIRIGLSDDVLELLACPASRSLNTTPRWGQGWLWRWHTRGVGRAQRSVAA